MFAAKSRSCLRRSREHDIRGIVKFVAETKTKGIIVGGEEAWKVADDLKKNDISVIYTNIYSLPVRDDDPYDFFLRLRLKCSKRASNSR